MSPLADQIYAARTRKGWSQRDLAMQMGVSQQTIAHWETGGMPRTRSYGKLLNLLEMDTSEQASSEELTQRDYFAAKSMNGIMASRGQHQVVNRDIADNISFMSYSMAAAMLRMKRQIKE